jgi:colanic acid biosynthesis glycosyl transferase WcaI
VTPKLWFVSELYYPEETSTGGFLTGIAEGVAGELDTGVICSQPTYARRGVSAPRREVRNGVTIRRFRGTRFDPTQLPGRLVNAATISLVAFIDVWRTVRRGDIVVVVTNPPTLPIVAKLACRMRGARIVLLVHDVYPEILAVSGIVRHGSVAFRMLDRLSRLVYRGFAHVVVLGRDMQSLVAAKIGVPPERLSIITNWGDGDAVRPSAGENPLRARLGMAGKFVVQYAGNIGRTHGVETLLDAARELRDDPSTAFMIIGSGAGRAAVDRAIASENLGNVTLLEPVPREELGTALNACDVSVVTFRPGMKGVSVPSRVYNVLAAGKPLIVAADAGSEVGLLVREEEVGWVVEPGDARGLAAAIGEARSAPERRRAMGDRARRLGEARYSRQAVIEQWKSLLRGMISSR